MKFCPNILVERNRSSRSYRPHAFTLLEMLMVISLIALLAAIGLPLMRGFGKSNTVNVAIKQMLADVSMARQKAIATRSDVYMVFVQPNFWDKSIPLFDNRASYGSLDTTGLKQATELASGQYVSYALVSKRSVGDQPGRPYAHYLTAWKTLPQGMLIAPNKFIYKDVVQIGTNAWLTVSNFDYVSVLFPSTAHGVNFSMPCIGFNAQGQLLSPYDQYISLSQGTFFPPVLPNLSVVNFVETPPGNSTNLSSFALIHIDPLTGRAKLERQEIR